MEQSSGEIRRNRRRLRNGTRHTSPLIICRYLAAKLAVDPRGAPGAKWGKAAAKFGAIGGACAMARATLRR